MRREMILSVGAIFALLALATPALAQGFCGVPADCGFGGPAGYGIGCPGPYGIDAPIGCGLGVPFGGFGPGCGIGVPFGLGGFGFGSPLLSIVGLGIAMIESVIGAAFSCIPGLGFGGCGIPFGGCCF